MDNPKRAPSRFKAAPPGGRRRGVHAGGRVRRGLPAHPLRPVKGRATPGLSLMPVPPRKTISGGPFAPVPVGGPAISPAAGRGAAPRTMLKANPGGKRAPVPTNVTVPSGLLRLPTPPRTPTAKAPAITAQRTPSAIGPYPTRRRKG